MYSIEKKDIYNINKKDNTLRLVSSINIIIYVDNYSSLYFTTKNQKGAFMIWDISEDEEKCENVSRLNTLLITRLSLVTSHMTHIRI